jgi:hypothetical protein
MFVFVLATNQADEDVWLSWEWAPQSTNDVMNVEAVARHLGRGIVKRFIDYQISAEECSTTIETRKDCTIKMETTVSTVHRPWRTTHNQLRYSKARYHAELNA